MNLEEKLLDYPLFKDLSCDEIKQLMACIKFVPKNYKKNEYLLFEGEKVNRIGIILSGTVVMEKDDLLGNSYLFRTLNNNELFGEPFLAREPILSSVNYKAMTDCDILYFNYQELLTLCEKHCRCHKVMTDNLIFMLSDKTRSLISKIEILSKNSMRERIMTFFALVYKHYILFEANGQLSDDAKVSHNEITLPYNHTEMARYLCVNRSAMLRELHRMEEEGIITCTGAMYTVHFDQDPDIDDM